MSYRAEVDLEFSVQEYVEFMRYCISKGKITISTLGPSGTSSEYTCLHLAKHINVPCSVMLHDSYEDAYEAVVSGKSDFLVVANAYGAINNFYINDELSIAYFFICDTPLYGVAVNQKSFDTDKLELKLATHPAPAHLVKLLSEELRRKAVTRFTNSTSEAAGMVRSGEVDMCITNATSASLHKLDFISNMKPIRMLWTVFSSKTKADC